MSLKKAAAQVALEGVKALVSTFITTAAGNLANRYVPAPKDEPEPPRKKKGRKS